MATGQLMDRDEDIGDDSSQAMALATTRQAQEVQAAMIVARKFPRDEQKAIAKIMNACKRMSLAEMSQYEYARGGTSITGPSIRLAEVLAQCWGNIDFGVVELERKHGASVAMSYCWDLETNVRQTKVFTVQHTRDTRQGQKALRDERDVYEVVANNGARRLRACILGVIPGDIQDMAIEECDKTLAGENREPLIDRVRKMVLAFQEIGVSPAMLEAKVNHKLDAVTLRELARLGKVFTAIRDGIGTIEEHFKQDAPANGEKGKSQLEDLADQLQGAVVGKPANAPSKSTDERLQEFLIAVAANQNSGEPTKMYDVLFGSESTVEWTPEQDQIAAKATNAREQELLPKRGIRGNAKSGQLLPTGTNE